MSGLLTTWHPLSLPWAPLLYQSRLLSLQGQCMCVHQSRHQPLLPRLLLSHLMPILLSQDPFWQWIKKGWQSKPPKMMLYIYWGPWAPLELLYRPLHKQFGRLWMLLLSWFEGVWCHPICSLWDWLLRFLLGPCLVLQQHQGWWCPLRISSSSNLLLQSLWLQTHRLRSLMCHYCLTASPSHKWWHCLHPYYIALTCPSLWLWSSTMPRWWCLLHVSSVLRMGLR